MLACAVLSAGGVKSGDRTGCRFDGNITDVYQSPNSIKDNVGVGDHIYYDNEAAYGDGGDEEEDAGDNHDDFDLDDSYDDANELFQSLVGDDDDDIQY